MSGDVAEALAQARARISAACHAAGRSPADVLLIGVTKTHPPEVARAAVAAGLIDLGENRVQELTAKLPLVDGARWHLVGRLQRNKVRDVVGRQVLVHSVDRPRLAEALSHRAHREGVLQRALVQVNVGDDPAKGGCSLDEVDDLVAYARDLPNLAIEGLMTIPPLPPASSTAPTPPSSPTSTSAPTPELTVDAVDQAAEARPHFAALREARDRVRARYPEVVHLSMGMSADLEAAVAEGATMVRLGTALFGPRGDGPWRKDEG